MRRIIKNQKGSLLFMSIIVLTGVLGAALSAASLILSGIMISGTQSRSVQAYYAADAGIEEVLFWARSSNTSTTTLAISHISSVATGTLANTATFDVDYTTWVRGHVIGDDAREGAYVRHFNSGGEYNNVRRTVEAQYGFVPWDQIIEEKCDSNNLNLCTTEVACENIGHGYWYSGACNSSPPLDDIADYDAGGGICETENLGECETSGDCGNEGGFWYNDYCYDCADPELSPPCP